MVTTPSPDFHAQYPKAAAWVESAHKFSDFAQSLYRQWMQKGYLSPRQIEAAERSADRRDQHTAVKEETSRIPVDLSKMTAVFAKALAREVVNPALMVMNYKFHPAKDTGKNPGAIYVKLVIKGQYPEYLGKIMNGRFFPTNKVTSEMAEEIIAIASDPLAGAISHGRLTCRCSVCNLPLKDEKSVERGIGPVCFEKFFA